MVDTVEAAVLIGSATLVLAGRGLISWIKYRRGQHAARAAAFMILQAEGSAAGAATSDAVSGRRRTLE